MSSEMKILEQSKKAVLMRVPALRFPEFCGSKEWQVSSISDLFSLKKKSDKVIDFDKEKVITVKLHANGVVKNERNGTLTGGANYFIRHAGQFVFSKIDLLNGAFGLIPFELDGFCTSSDVPAFYFKQEDSALFFINWLKANYRKIKIERTGTSSTLKRISIDKFLDIPIPLPDIQEQQKIADCLSSLDNVISLQMQKIDSLQQYKKGLMQKLFPAEGETVPEWRFGKFIGGWNIRNLGELVSIKTGKKNTQDKVPDGKYPFFVRSQQVENIDTYSFDGEAILTAGDGVGVGKVFHYINGKFDYHQRVYCLSDFRSFVFGKYIYEVFKKKFGMETAKYSAKNSVDSVRMEMITGMKIPLPSLNEQQKIANCLSSLDEQITAETQKLTVLKIHKIGLMQQLFPSMDEVNA